MKTFALAVVCALVAGSAAYLVASESAEAKPADTGGAQGLGQTQVWRPAPYEIVQAGPHTLRINKETGSTYVVVRKAKKHWLYRVARVANKLDTLKPKNQSNYQVITVNATGSIKTYMINVNTGATWRLEYYDDHILHIRWHPVDILKK